MQERGILDTMDTLVSNLSQFAIFDGLDEHTLQEIIAHAHRRSFPAGQVIVLADTPTRAVYLVVNGQVRIQRSSLEGREYVLHSLGPGQCFNLASALDGGFNLATVSALTHTVTYVLPADAFRRIVSDHPQLSMALLRHMASQVWLQIVVVLAGYVMLAWLRYDLKTILYVFSVGCALSFMMEFSLLMTRVRPQSVRVLIYETLVLTNQGVPYFFVIRDRIVPWIARGLAARRATRTT